MTQQFGISGGRLEEVFQALEGKYIVAVGDAQGALVVGVLAQVQGSMNGDLALMTEARTVSQEDLPVIAAFLPWAQAFMRTTWGITRPDQVMTLAETGTMPGRRVALSPACPRLVVPINAGIECSAKATEKLKGMPAGSMGE